MAKKNKTTQTDVDVFEFIESYVDKEQKKEDSHELIRLMTQWSGFEPKMWGPTIIGFGSYHYKYASGHEGDAAMLGFSPRKAQFSLYVYSDTEKSQRLLEDLGKFKMGKACIYIKKLSDINVEVLKELCIKTIAYLNEHHECACHT
ncbi:DUF1801 domain-containing protein [Bradymonas sediminis]|uniref:DUF1801 domain-containing protein n=1 Tax=Bradymonas sediminis TaxID=1548548 RepID=A0A2Z4FH69_9DELT|nr:DUF1801 domain-containing protein [Bradymonas sediminis]AWV88259.1 DUF1801 domain-containing protein [Bradymonas sediminis]TDP77382.1 uncharacterized protein DUF1801 [Bradymonas sediminis]